KAHTLAGERDDRARVAAEVATRRDEEAARAEAIWRGALAEVGCADVGAWEARLAVEARRADLEARIGELRATLVGALGSGWQDEARWLIDGEPAGLAEWERRADALAAAYEAAAAEFEALETERAEKRVEAQRLATATDVIDADTALASAEAELADARRAWWRVQLASHLLEDTFERFRRERQPAVIRKASEWFALATGGAYERVEAVEDDGPLRFDVCTASGARHPADGLSTGTIGLLYLCLRLALALDQAAVTTAAPLLLDDVLVHADPERAAAAAKVLAALAREAPELQILLFTCRPETVACVQAELADASVVTLARWGGAAGPVDRPQRTQASASSSRGGAPRTLVLAPAGDDGASVEEAVALLAARGEPLAKSDFCDELGLGGSDWARMRPVLEAHPRVAYDGEKRGRRYFLAEHGRDDDGGDGARS
ncbi:MAG: hypothetical protein KC635_13215, partial [Myxococcales bacterium]|nr:hypothetical protein [Myxococcales bacterium]